MCKSSNKTVSFYCPNCGRKLKGIAENKKIRMSCYRCKGFILLKLDESTNHLAIKFVFPQK